VEQFFTGRELKMNFLSGFFKNLLALAIGAVATALVLLIASSVIDCYRGGFLPEEEKANLLSEKQKLDRKEKKLESEIAELETKIKNIESSDSNKYIKKVKSWYKHKFIRKIRLKLFFFTIRVKNKLKSIFRECFRRNGNNV
jgi:hypothetical protein